MNLKIVEISAKRKKICIAYIITNSTFKICPSQSASNHRDNFVLTPSFFLQTYKCTPELQNSQNSTYNK